MSLLVCGHQLANCQGMAFKAALEKCTGTQMSLSLRHRGFNQKGHWHIVSMQHPSVCFSFTGGKFSKSLRFGLTIRATAALFFPSISCYSYPDILFQ